MSGSWMPIWLALLVAGVIALTAFALGQLIEGAGVMFVIVASTGWVAYSAMRQRRYQNRK